MADMSISTKQGRSPKKRPYRMKRRAEQVDETRQRITEAAVKLHTTVGPAHTSISKVAEEADVTRLTVYRHFADLDALFVACMGHWNATHPGPDVEAWLAVEHLDDRARRAFGDLYRWYEQHQAELYPIFRDWTAMPESAQRAQSAQTDAVATAVLGSGGDDAAPAGRARITAAIARHLVDFWTWHSLTADRGLSTDEAAAAAATILLGTDG